jgi:hypothetical protein
LCLNRLPRCVGRDCGAPVAMALFGQTGCVQVFRLLDNTEQRWGLAPVGLSPYDIGIRLYREPRIIASCPLRVKSDSVGARDFAAEALDGAVRLLRCEQSA